jgi:hypothetical protein
MTMETYHWERKHQSDPPLSISIVRTLPEGNWTVRSEGTTLPPEFPTRYDTLKAAMAAADEIAVKHVRHNCDQRGCGEWLPLPPTHNVTPDRTSTWRGSRAQGPRSRAHTSRVPRSLMGGVAGALALTAVHEVGRRLLTHAPRMDEVAMRGLRRILPRGQRDPRRLHQLALGGDLVSNSLYYSAIAAPTSKATWTRAVVLGTAAGVGALLLPERLGLGAPQNSEHRANQFMTIGWYLAGALAAAFVATRMRDA